MLGCQRTWKSNRKDIFDKGRQANAHSASVGREGRKLDQGHDGVVEKAADVDESRQPVGVQSNVAASILPLTLAAVSHGRSGPTGGRGTAAAASLRGAAREKVLSVPVQNSAGASGRGAMSTPAEHVWGNSQPRRISSIITGFSEEDDMDDIHSPELGGRATREQR